MGLAESHAARAGERAERERAEAERRRYAPASWLAEHADEVRELCALERELGEREERARAAHLRSICADPPEDLIAALGGRPEGLAYRAEWERAAVAIASYEREEGARELLGAEPASWEERGAWREMRAEVSAFSREAGRELGALELPGPAEHELDTGMEIDPGW
jgi:hypothetical protein